MNIPKEKLRLIEWIVKESNEENLAEVSAFVERLSQDTNLAAKVMGYRRRGVPVTWQQMKDTLQVSIEECINGNAVSLDSLEKESDTW
jgi:hypothetical protein